MALKRKEQEESRIAPQKKVRTDVEQEEDAASGKSANDIVKFTENGDTRAKSESRRTWKFVCPVDSCEQRFNRPCRLESHLRTHSKERPFTCDEPGCDKAFPRKDHLQRHIKRMHTDAEPERPFACDWQGCGKSFESNSRLRRHKDVHASKFYCTEYPPCNEAFRKEKSLHAHVKSNHLDLKPWPCTYVDPETGKKCPCAFQRDFTLQQHMVKHYSEEQDGGIFCMLCSSSMDSEESGSASIEPLEFETTEQLEAHVAEAHPPTCSVCGQRFKNAANLKSHVDVVHGDPADQPQFPCPNPYCDSVFNRKHNLTVHIQSVHEKQLRFFCATDALKDSKHGDLKGWNGENACGAAFKHKSSLEQHVRTHHLGLGNRKQLRKAAKSKKKPDPSMLTMLTGVGYEQGREVSCLVPTCQYRFYMDRDLRRHMRATHNMDDSEIQEKLLERDALSGGQFWIGGLNDTDNNGNATNMLLDSAEASMPETPTPHGSSTIPPFPPYSITDPLAKGGEAQLDVFDHLALLDDEEAELDRAMGLGNLAPATDAREGLWDALAPVERFNHTHE